ncbi:MAG: UDP-N-acetylmuramate--L-alanine ligase [bacterium]
MNHDQLAAVRAILAGPPTHAHLLGMAGVGMAGVAVHLAHRGFRVTGCDLFTGPIVDWLRARGIAVDIGHSPTHITSDVGWLVRSAAVDESDPEILAARARGLPVFARGEVLPALLDGRRSVAVSGTHGKTTTTAMVAHVLRGAGIDCGFCIGGEFDALGGVAGAGSAREIVVEADESDGTVELYEPDYALITNAELDHVDFFPSRASLIDCLSRFAVNARTRAVLCADDAGTLDIAARATRPLLYGLSEDAHVRGVNIVAGPGSVTCDVISNARKMGNLTLPILGIHNIVNALGTCAVALDMDVPFEKIQSALAVFRPVRRRFERVHDAGGITVISDYAHHPTEIRCLVEQAKALGKGRIVAVFQPHRYSRTRTLGPDFPAAFEGLDRLVLVPVYAASERPVPGGTTNDLYVHCRARGNVPVENAASLREAWGKIRGDLRCGDLFLVIGAGDVEKIAFWAKDVLQRKYSPIK